MIPFSVLDLSPVPEGATVADALRNTLDLSRHAERWGYRRYWLAEHHNLPGIGSAATAVLIGQVAAATSTIRVGSGGIMLPNHQPLVVAEQIATLEALHPGRIDLGVGRSLGFTSAVRAALRSGRKDAEHFEEDVAELLAHLSGTAPVTARPRDRATTPVFVLATGAGADVAARSGLAVVLGGPALSRAGAGRGAPVLERYRALFRPSPWWPEPHVVVSANVAVAGTREAARRLLLPEAHALALSRTRGEFPSLAPADAAPAASLPPRAATLVEESLATSVHGTALDVEARLARLLADTRADELLVTGGAYDVEAQAESDRLLAGLFARPAAAARPGPARACD
ncbi:MAG: MsnO8 family LLM class oxidoreductase [Actinomycetota bacterium]